jgi:cell division protein FtsI/penicillin-binding protein 2
MPKNAIRKSNNRAAVQTAMLIGEQQFCDCLTEYGFGETTEYGFDGESAGILFLISKWDAWTITRMTMGCAVYAIPLQTHCAISTIANDGMSVKPNVFRYVMDGDNKILTVNLVIKRQVISRHTRICMRKVMHNPRNRKLKTRIEFRRKNGAGQKIIDGQYSHDRHTS